VAVEQRHSEPRLELLHPRGDVRLHAVQPGGGLGDPAGVGHGFEDLEGGQVHRCSRFEMKAIMIIHFA
jgi:hypothetical protein